MGGGPKEFGGTKGMLLYLLVPPKSLFCSSNSIYSPPQTIVLSPQIPNHLLSPQNNCSVPSNSVSSRPQNHSVPSNSVVGPLEQWHTGYGSRMATTGLTGGAHCRTDGKEGGGKLRGQQWAARVKLAAASLSVPRHQQGLHHVQQLAKELGRNTG